MTPFRVVGLIAKQRDVHEATVAAVCATLRAAGCTVLIDDNDALPGSLCGTRVPRERIAAEAQLAVVVGGDGTLLDAGRSLAPAGIPILGVNQGRLGFLTDVRADDLEPVLRAVLSGECETESRMLLSVSISGAAPQIAVNDLVLRNQATIRMLEFETWMDEELISAHRADGVIISSPTGSTAYALSGGGPLMHPGLSAIAVVPICPHTLSDRPIVVGGDRSIRLLVRGAERTQAMATIDGQISRILEPGDTVTISRSAQPLNLIHPCGFSWFSLLRNKLRWGSGPDPISERA
jgi:NAD+ kinase